MSSARNISRIEAGGIKLGLKSMQVFATPGTFTWTKPANITRIRVIVTGGGGGGATTQQGATGANGVVVVEEYA